MLVQAAWSAARTRDTCLSAQFARKVDNDHRRDQAIRNLHELGSRVTLEHVA